MNYYINIFLCLFLILCLAAIVDNYLKARKLRGDVFDVAVKYKIITICLLYGENMELIFKNGNKTETKNVSNCIVFKESVKSKDNIPILGVYYEYSKTDTNSKEEYLLSGLHFLSDKDIEKPGLPEKSKDYELAKIVVEVAANCPKS